MSNILIVDDEHALLEPLSEQLLTEGHQVQTVGCGEAGLERMRAQRPDLVLLDVDLPGMDGYEVCSRMQADPVLEQIPVIMLTSHEQVADPEGADSTTPRPSSIQELLSRVRAQLRRPRRARVSDLTGLPGSEAVQEALAGAFRSPERRSALHVEITHLRVYNEAYSFTEGDNLIRLAAESLSSAIAGCGDPDAFLGHMGGAGFVAIVDRRWETCIVEGATAHFDERVQRLYSHRDRARGYVVALDRDGIARRWPLATLHFRTVRQGAERAGV